MKNIISISGGILICFFLTGAFINSYGGNIDFMSIVRFSTPLVIIVGIIYFLSKRKK